MSLIIPSRLPLSAMFVVLALGCVSVPDRLEETLRRSEYVQVVDEGTLYLRDHPTAKDAGDVRRLVSQAGYALAREENTVGALRAFRQSVEGWPEAIFERGESLIHEAEVAFMAVTKRNVPAGYVSFRAEYPQSRRVADAVRMEVGAAFAEAERADTVNGWRRFLETYGARDDAEEYRDRARRNEAGVAFRALRRGATASAVAAFRARYQGAYNVEKVAAFERTVLFREARQIDTLPAYAALRIRYGADPFAAPGLMALRHRELDLANRALLEGAKVARCVALFDVYAQWSTLSAILDRVRGRCARAELASLRATPTGPSLEAFFNRYGQHDEVIPELSDAADLLYAIAPSGERDEGEAWLADSRTLHRIYGPLVPYLADAKSTAAQAKARKRQLEETLRGLQSALRGAPVELLAARVVGASPESTLTARGRKRVKRLVRKMKGHPGLSKLLELSAGAELDALGAFYLGPGLKGCRKCVRDTGRYLVELEVPIPLAVRGYADAGDAEAPVDAERAEASSYAKAEGFAGAPYGLRWWHLPSSDFPVLGHRDAHGSGGVSPSGAQAAEVAMVSARIEHIVDGPDDALSLPRGHIMRVTGRLVGFTYDGRQLRVRIE